MRTDLTKKSATNRFVPNTMLAYLAKETIRKIPAQEVFGKGRILAIGIPGAYTPICTQQHIPNLLDNAKTLEANGFNKLICIAPNDPFVLKHWAQELDPKGEVSFFSDGNLEFFRALAMTTKVEDLFLGERCRRFMMIVEDGRIVQFRVEKEVTHFTCTGAEEALQLVVPSSTSQGPVQGAGKN